MHILASLPVLSASERALVRRYTERIQDLTMFDGYDYWDDYDSEEDMPMRGHIRDRRAAQARSEMGFNDRAPFAKRHARRAERRMHKVYIREALIG